MPWGIESVSDNDSGNSELFTVRPPPGVDGDVYSASTVATQAPADLLDLVRAAEEEAKLAKLPTSATKFHAAAPGSNPPPQEEFVDVGDDAIDAPPSLAPIRAATPAVAFRPPSEEAVPPRADVGKESEAKEREAIATRAEPKRNATSVSRPAPKAPSTRAPMPPIAAIVLVFMLASAALALLTR